MLESSSSDEEENDEQNTLDYPKERAQYLIGEAGQFIKEDPDQITLVKYEHLLCDTVHHAIQEMLEECKLPFQLQEFQLVTGWPIYLKYQGVT